MACKKPVDHHKLETFCKRCQYIEDVWPDLSVLIDYSMLDKKDQNFILAMVKYLKNKVSE